MQYGSGERTMPSMLHLPCYLCFSGQFSSGVAGAAAVPSTSAHLTASSGGEGGQFFQVTEQQEEDIKSPDKTVARIVEDWGSDDET